MVEPVPVLESAPMMESAPVAPPRPEFGTEFNKIIFLGKIGGFYR